MKEVIIKEEILFSEGDTVNLKNSDAKGFLFKILSWTRTDFYNDETPFKTIIIENSKARKYYVVEEKHLSLYNCRIVLTEKYCD